MKKINVKEAFSLRQRGLYLPVSAHYDDERVKEIAERQSQLMSEFEVLDKKLKRISNGSLE